MTRLRVAQVLAVVATLAVLGTAAVTATRPREGDGRSRSSRPEPAAVSLAVRDPTSGASFEVPGDDWQVEDRRIRLYYADAAGDPVAVVRGPAVFRSGYCAARPKGSNHAFAGFTEQEFGAWVEALGRAASETASSVRLADGTAAQLRRAHVDLVGSGPCAAPAADVAMVRVGDVRVVLVADAGVPGALQEEQVAQILTSLRLP
ncbi:hypothetical protein [Nocardioides sp. T2.26MG-1]|uniref:hypothetical protein n=1 Tax=Nocardioides sp. T2.26MG-1 TaxID=3041166 RepID=UPI00247737C0|nr:hypothetical protein [Nocardioides sp. T2.26MG-1]CAI9398942.1 hypothetical protein HIDPHFAB_00093 [Nocardioides sp. T2.26MG-1]